MQELEYKGTWWLPENKENYTSGILTFNSDEGAYLELTGKLIENDEIKPDLILGKTSDGKSITLYKCSMISKEINCNGFHTTVVFASVIFEGVNFNLEEDIKFDEISCNYTNLDEWAWIGQTNINTSSNDEHELPNRVTADVNDGYTIEIFPNAQKEYVKIINKNLNPFEQHIDNVYYIQNLINLGIGVPTTIIDVIGKIKVNKSDLNKQIIYSKVIIYFCTKQLLKEYKPILNFDMLFVLRDIKDDFRVALKKYFDDKKVLKPVLNLYFDTLYYSEMYMEQIFLSLFTQVINAYNRRIINTEIQANQYEKILNYVIDECDIFPNLSSSNAQGKFVLKICDSQNYFTHYDINLADKAAKGVELVEICDKLKIVIQFNLLLEIGFNDAKAHRLIENYILQLMKN